MRADAKSRKSSMPKSNHGELHCQSRAALCEAAAFHWQCLVSRKQQYKDLAETMTKTDEKLSYQIGTIQSSISNMNTRLAGLQDLVVVFLAGAIRSHASSHSLERQARDCRLEPSARNHRALAQRSRREYSHHDQSSSRSGNSSSRRRHAPSTQRGQAQDRGANGS